MPASKVSICITTKNRHRLLRETLLSIKRQSFFDYEVIVWDNGQHANIVVSEFDARFKYFTSEDSKTYCMSEGFNKALSLATGEYVLFLSDDDLLYPEALSVLTTQIEDEDMTIGATDMLQDDITIAKCTFHKKGINSCMSQSLVSDVFYYLTNNEFMGALLSNKYKMYLFWSAALIKREIAIKVGGFPNYSTTLMGDFIYLLKTAKLCTKDIRLINTPVCAQRVHSLNHGRVSDCKELKIIRGIFMTECGSIVGSKTFVSSWMVGHCTFLKQYFKRLNIPNKLPSTMFWYLTWKEYIKVYAGYYLINFLNFIRSLV